MHVLFLAPDTHTYNHQFIRALKVLGVQVSAIGQKPKDQLSETVRPLLDRYETVSNITDGQCVVAAAEQLARNTTFDRVETIDEPLVIPAAMVRERLSIPGLSVHTAKLCRDKVAMQEFLRSPGVPCAQSAGARSASDVRVFAERVGYPLILKPIAGYGTLNTHRANHSAQLDEILQKTQIDEHAQLAVEEFIDGHEGFYDTITEKNGIRHDFAAHYYPGCLEASIERRVAPQIAVTNRIEQDGYRELRALGSKVIAALGLHHTATHMEWFQGSKGIKFSEIGARPAGEKIWDLYRFANEFDVFLEWALAILDRPTQQKPSRRFATGSVQIRPDRDGKFAEHQGIDAAWQRCRPFIYEYEVPEPGTDTKPLDKGWLCNTWFRLRHEDYDQLRALMTFLGETVRSKAR